MVRFTVDEFFLDSSELGSLAEAQARYLADLETARLEAPVLISSTESSHRSPASSGSCRMLKVETKDSSPVAGPSRIRSALSPGSLSDISEMPFEDPSDLLRLRSLPDGVDCPGNPSRLRVSGVVWMIMRTLYDAGHLSVTMDAFEKMMTEQPILNRYSEVALVVITTLQTITGLPQIKDTHVRWAEEEPLMVVPDLSVGMGFGQGLEPWEGTLWNSLDTWILAMEIIPRFLPLSSAVSEAEFLQALSGVKAQAEASVWRVHVIVAVLFTLKHAPWFWSFLI